MAERIGVEWAIISNAVAYIVATVLVWRIQMDPHATTGGADSKEPGGWGDLKTGLVYLWQHHSALSLSLLSAVFAFLAGVFAVEIVGYTMETLGLRTGGFGYLLVAAGAGAALGIGLVGRGKSWTKAAWLPFVQLLLVGAVLILMGLTARVWITVLLLFVLGAIAATILIPIDAKLQEEVRRQTAGRGVCRPRDAHVRHHDRGVLAAIRHQTVSAHPRAADHVVARVWLDCCRGADRRDAATGTPQTAVGQCSLTGFPRVGTVATQDI